MLPEPSSAPAAGAGAEVLRGDLVEELAELLDLVLLLVGDLDADLVEELLGPEDRGTRADGEGDGVRRAGADRPLVAEDQLGDVDAVAHLGDVDRLEGGAEGADDLAQQIVGHRPGGPHALLLEGDPGCLARADPDREVPLAVRLLQQQDRLVPGQLDADADNSKLLHGSAPMAAARG